MWGKTRIVPEKTIILLIVSLIPSHAGINCPGCTPLDGLSFDKLIGKFPASLVKFDVAYPYGDAHEEFAKVSKEAMDVSDLFIGEVGVKDYADRDNEHLATRFEITKDDFPAVVLFVNDGKDVKHLKFTDEFKAENLKQFVQKNSGIYLPLAGCVGEFDDLAGRLVKFSSKDVQISVLEKAKVQLESLEEGSKTRKQAEIYVKVMNKIIDSGVEFIKKEETRLKKIKAGKVTKEKKEEIEGRLNILKSFIISKEKTEL